jgi:hypothetical protein
MSFLFGGAVADGMPQQVEMLLYKSHVSKHDGRMRFLQSDGGPDNRKERNNFKWSDFGR